MQQKWPHVTWGSGAGGATSGTGTGGVSFDVGIEWPFGVESFSYTYLFEVKRFLALGIRAQLLGEGVQ